MLQIIPVLIIIGLVVVFKTVMSSQGKRTGNSEKRPVIMSPEITKPESLDKDDGIHEPDSPPPTVKLKPDREKWIHMEKKKRAESKERFVRQKPAMQEQMSSRTTRKKRKGPLQHLTQAKLREGIVLAEILSEKPRAKNPYPASYRYRRTKS